MPPYRPDHLARIRDVCKKPWSKTIEQHTVVEQNRKRQQRGTQRVARWNRPQIRMIENRQTKKQEKVRTRRAPRSRKHILSIRGADDATDGSTCGGVLERGDIELLHLEERLRHPLSARAVAATQ